MKKPNIDRLAEEARLYLCEYLKSVAAEKEITQQQIADYTGMERSNINRIFTGKYSPSLDNFIKISDAIGVYFFIVDKEREDINIVKAMRDRHKRPNDSN